MKILRSLCAESHSRSMVLRVVFFTILTSITIAAAQQQSSSTSTQPEIAKTRVAWHDSLVRLPKPKAGCYVSTFPRVEWKAATCGEGPKYPILPARNPATHFVVGGGGSNDFAANPVGGNVAGIDGTFVSVSPGISESGPVGNSGPSLSDTYTLQINTNQFSSATCSGSPNPNCKGWEQFIYENNSSSHRVFIQYWLIQYNTTCPSSSWQQFQFSGSTDIYCFQSTSTSSLPSGEPVSNLGNLKFSAAVTSTSDQVVISDGTHAAMITGSNAVAAAGGWADGEFNIFADGGNSSGGGQASFGANTTLQVKTTVHNGTKNAPNCDMASFTGETTTLTLVGTAPIPTQASPAIEFTESNIPGTAAACVTAAGIGDTHLTTFNGLLYDFQASGDFVLVESGKDFIVENRQLSGAPTWPSAAVNKAVATQMGKTRVAVCTAPSRIAVDGEVREIADGKTLSLPDGVDIQHIGSAYLVVDQSGNSMRAQVNGSYIDLSVGLGHWPAKVQGVLANANNNINQIAARSGAVFTAPFAFNDLYHTFADSWRVSERESLLSPCGREFVTGIPQQPFYANNLPTEAYKNARAICTRAGVKGKSLLDACTLDVAVIGTEDAAKVYVGMRPPRAEGLVGTTRGGKGGYGDGNKDDSYKK